MLEVDNLHKRYRSGPISQTVFNGLGLSLAAGETVALLGASGSGKTTLLNLLAGIDTPDGGRVTLDGFYDGVPELPDALRRQWEALGFDGAAFLGEVDLSVPVGEPGRMPLEVLWARPTAEVNGISGGYTGEGTKTILPHRATAKVDSRLPPDIDPDEAMAKIRAHLDNNGYADIEIRQLGGYPAAQTSIEAAPVQAALSVFKKYSENIAVQPRIAGSAPFYQFTKRLGLPLVPAGMGLDLRGLRLRHRIGGEQPRHGLGRGRAHGHHRAVARQGRPSGRWWPEPGRSAPAGNSRARRRESRLSGV